MPQIPIELIHFPQGNKARVLRVHQDSLPAEIVAALDIPPARAVVVLNGGTASLDLELQQQLDHLLADGLARTAATEQITMITGGTDAGIFSLLGTGLSRYRRTAPCIGVAVAGLVTGPNHGNGEARLEPHHSHFVLVEGHQWGDETAIMYALLDQLAQQCPSLGIFAGGGEVTVKEMQTSMQQGQPMILLAGSQRATDAVLTARSGKVPNDIRILNIARHNQIISFDMGNGPEAFGQLIRHILFSTSIEDYGGGHDH